jgi:galactonate dehydratase
VRITDFELFPVRASSRTVWLIVRVRTDVGISGLGEASDAFGFANTTVAQARQMELELGRFVQVAAGCASVDIAEYWRLGAPLARAGGVVSATGFSAIEQALWDISGQAAGVPVWQLLGTKQRDSLTVYANINRASLPRTPEGFAETARRAVAEGFRAVKAAPFDGFPGAGVAKHLDQGIACMYAIREAVGPDIEVMVDCHGFFTLPMAIDVAERLEECRLSWYEEPVAPEQLAETLTIRVAIRQKMAGGEMLFGTDGFAPLCEGQAVDIIMPDVKHCGGLAELAQIARVAAATGITVAPHNPSGPVSTAASVQVGAVLPNFGMLELQWGEVGWRGELVVPEERFDAGMIRVPGLPGFGIELNEKLARAHAV